MMPATAQNDSCHATESGSHGSKMTLKDATQSNIAIGGKFILLTCSISQSNTAIHARMADGGAPINHTYHPKNKIVIKGTPIKPI